MTFDQYTTRARAWIELGTGTTIPDDVLETTNEGKAIIALGAVFAALQPPASANTP
jgi:hypothetical protein